MIHLTESLFSKRIFAERLECAVTVALAAVVSRFRLHLAFIRAAWTLTWTKIDEMFKFVCLLRFNVALKHLRSYPDST